ncbi:MAG: transcriptional regulator [Magnetospirillum sp.]|nr:MAG: transcriptional regulator [Magnetospirillum sp.]
MAKAKGWHKSDIKAALEKRGLTLSDLDKFHGLPEGTCSATLRKPHPKGEAAISGALGIHPKGLWPDRYAADGIRKRPQPAANYRPRPQVGHRQKSEAA